MSGKIYKEENAKLLAMIPENLRSKISLTLDDDNEYFYLRGCILYIQKGQEITAYNEKFDKAQSILEGHGITLKDTSSFFKYRFHMVNGFDDMEKLLQSKND